MEKLTFYQAFVEVRKKPSNWEDENSKLQWAIISTFKNKNDAEFAGKLYGAVYNSIYSDFNVQCTGKFKVNELSIPQAFTNAPHYMSLDEFIEQNAMFDDYRKKFGTVALDKLLKEMGVETQQEKNLRIIERMIRQYQYRLKIDANTGTDEKTIEGIKENIQFLQDLRDGKIELK